MQAISTLCNFATFLRCVEMTLCAYMFGYTQSTVCVEDRHTILRDGVFSINLFITCTCKLSEQFTRKSVVSLYNMSVSYNG
jgi:hypothetical protein